jgi:YidC/Oxa1 family membrane protein insertase
LGQIIQPLYDVVSWIIVVFHKLWSPIFGPNSGATWTLSIVSLVVLIRIVLIPLFVKQIKAQRGLALLQPEIKKLQEKHKGDKEKQSQELMKLYKETGTNPLASCLPLIVQAPIFFALFHVLRSVAHNPPQPIGAITQSLAESAAQATFFGAHLSDSFVHSSSTETKVITIVMILLMSLSQFITQRQLMVKNVSAEAAAANPMAQQQKILLYVFPVMFAVFGIQFPIGVLIYWLTTNVWSMGQQFWVIRNMPSPGSEADKAYQARKAAKAARKSERSAGRTAPAPEAGTPSVDGALGTGGPAEGPSPDAAKPSTPVNRQRQQPSRQPKRKRGSGSPPGKR